MAITLTKEQQKAIESDAGHVCIVACAGSGKTTTLTKRIARIVNTNGVDPSSIAAITFTVLAADQLKYELAQVLHDKAASSEMFIGTIHSFCMTLLTAEDILSEGGYAPISEGQRFVLLVKNWRRWNLEAVAPGKSKTDVIEKLIATFDIVKMESISSAALTEKHPDVLRVLQLYNGFLKENGYLDYSDMLVMALQQLRDNEAFRSKVLGRYKFLFVDEYQDVDPVQAAFVDVFRKSSTVCVVGDDDQAIYQFRGADHRNLQQFATSASCVQLPLSENRRCPVNVLAVAEAAIMQIPKAQRLPKAMSANTPNGRVTIRHFEKLEDEIQFIVTTIQDAINTHEASAYGQFAVLMRSLASYGAQYVAALHKAGIPCIARGARTLFMAPEIQKLVAIMEWMAKDGDAIANLKLLAPLCTNGLDAAKLAERAEESSLLTVKDFVETGHSVEDYELLKKLEGIRTRYENRKFGCLLELVYDFIVILKLLSPSQPDSVRYNVALMTQIISEYEMIQDDKRFRSLCVFLATYAKGSYDEAMPVEKVEGAVTLLTVHQAKGLQYDYIFVPMLVEARFPVRDSGGRWLIDDSLFEAARYRGSIDNERRLFYVACTRARKALYLLASRDVGLTKPKAPSPFFADAQKVTLPQPVEIPNSADHVNKDAGHLVTTYSSLEYYLTCPYRYQLVVKLGLAFPQAVYFQFGKLIHDMFAWVNLSNIEGKPVAFDAACARLEEVFPLYYKNTNMRQYDIRKQKLRAAQALDNYLTRRATWVKGADEVERDFIYVDKSALVRGRYDLLVKKPDGCFSIVDYKTGKPHAGLRPDFQMAFYSLAAKTQLGVNVNEAVLYYVENDQPVVYQVTDAFLKDGEKSLRSVIDGVRSKNFTAAPKKGLCTQCEAKELCPFKA